jgi:hypothetical protein
MASFKELRDLPPPDPDKLAAYVADFPRRLALYEAKFRREKEALKPGKNFYRRSYNI